MLCVQAAGEYPCLSYLELGGGLLWGRLYAACVRSTLGWLPLTEDMSSLKFSSTCSLLQGMLLSSLRGGFPGAWLLRVLDLVLRREGVQLLPQTSLVWSPSTLGFFSWLPLSKSLSLPYAL